MLPMDAKAGFLSPAANFLTFNPAEDYWMADPTKNQMLYVNPACETIWGSTCESLYASPKNWFEAIHPDDRERVLQAALTGHSHGTYYDEYRIVSWSWRTEKTRWIISIVGGNLKRAQAAIPLSCSSTTRCRR